MLQHCIMGNVGLQHFLELYPYYGLKVRIFQNPLRQLFLKIFFIKVCFLWFFLNFKYWQFSHVVCVQKLKIWNLSLSVYSFQQDFGTQIIGIHIHLVNWQIVIPALTSLTAQSPGLTPFRSPSGPIHRVAATGLPVVFKTWTAHSASSTCSKYCKQAQK